MSESLRTSKKKRPIKWHRIKRRLLRHHVPLSVFSVLSVFLLFVVVDSEDAIYKYSMATAWPGLVLLAGTLMTGPLKVLRRRSISVSDDLTRDMGIWAAIVSLLHVIFGLQVHMRVRMWLLFVPENLEFPFIRLDLFGAANYTGLVGTIIVIMLLALSNDFALRKMGTWKWKRLQRWNYALFALIIAHGVMYQIIENRTQPYPALFLSIGAITVILQVMGFFYRKKHLREKGLR